MIDDRIPVYKKTGKVVFAQCRDPNELWVPFIEKAYAKLHGCYKALIGGYAHYALADMTGLTLCAASHSVIRNTSYFSCKGYSPRLVGLKEGYMGYSDKLDREEVWKLLIKYVKEWKSLLGCSIQVAACSYIP